MPALEPIKVKGLAEFSRALRKLDSDAPKALRLAANEAGELVVSYARPKVPDGPGDGGHASSSIRARSTRTAAQVSAGSKKFPYYAFLDFGGSVGRHKSVKRPFLRTGRYLFAGYVENRAEVADKLEQALVDVVRGAGLEVT